MLTQSRSLALNVNCKTIQPLEVKTGENMLDMGFGDQFSDMTTKAQSIKKDRLDFIKLNILL